MQSLAVFVDWWLAQLSSLVPAALAQSTSLSRAAVIVEHERQELRLLVRRAGRERQLARFRTGEAGVRSLKETLRAQGGVPRLLYLRLPAERILRKSLTLPAAVRRNLGEMLGFAIERETPFRRDEVHWTYVVRGQDVNTGMADVELLLSPRAHVDPLADLLRASGLTPSSIEIVGGTGESTLIPLGGHKRSHWRDARLHALATTAGILALVAIATPFGLQQRELARIESRIAALEASSKEAADLRRQAGQVAAAVNFLSNERRQNGSALAALAAATRSLPDDSYLRSLSLRSGRITMNGVSPAAAQLIGMLAESPEFREPAFEAPVTRDPRSELETFTISVALTPLGTP
jgi:general secretion pathway protein L